MVDGKRVRIEIDLTFIPAADLGGMKAGEAMSMRGRSFLTITDGKFTKIVDLS